MNEQHLRDALRAHAERNDPGHPPPPWEELQRRAGAGAGGRRWLVPVAGLAAAAVMAAVLAVAVTAGGDDDQVVVGDGTTTSTAEATPTTATSAPTTTTTTGGQASSEPVGVWPFATAAEARQHQASGSAEFSDPVATAEAFARQYLGMADPVTSEFHEGEPGAGEVEVRPNPRAGIVTVVILRQVGDGGPWTVLAAAAESIALDEPDPFAAVSSPVRVSGRARAFEGHVEVEVRASGRDPRVLGRGFVTASGGPELGPFEGEVSFEPPAGRSGAVVLLEPSAEDGSTLAATVVAVRFPAGD